MLLFQDSKIVQSVEQPVVIGSTITAEGQALVAAYASGVYGVKPSTGAAGEQFVGVAFSQQMTPLYLPNFESLTVNATTYQVTLAYTPAAGTLRIVNASGTVQTAGDPTTTANTYSITGNVVTFHSGQAGVVMTISYRYSPTTVQARSVQGDIPAGGSAGLTLNSVGVVTQGSIVTSEYDTSVNWGTGAAIIVTLGANGLFTIGGSGTVVPNAYVTKVPSAGDPYLGLHFAV